jgi:hypothetical protein
MEIQLRVPVDQVAELEPESVLPCQLVDGLFGAARLQSEKRLQLAVLQEALLTFHRFVGVDATRGRRLFAEAEDWFASAETDGPFTFVTICDSLNLDPDYIRKGLRRWRGLLDGAAKRRPPVHREGSGSRHRVTYRRLRQVA